MFNVEEERCTIGCSN